MVFCQKCGQKFEESAGFCGSCGTARSGQTQPVATQWSTPATFAVAPKPTTAGNGFSVAGIILGALAFLFFPIVLGPAGLILGAVGKSKGEEKAVIAMVVSAVGLVVGMILGYLVFSSMG